MMKHDIKPFVAHFKQANLTVFSQLITLMDVDEMIAPARHGSWAEMVRALVERERDRERKVEERKKRKNKEKKKNGAGTSVPMRTAT